MGHSKGVTRWNKSLIGDNEKEERDQRCGQILESPVWKLLVPLRSGQECIRGQLGDEVVQYSDSRLTNCLNACPLSSFHALLCVACMFAGKPMRCLSAVKVMKCPARLEIFSVILQRVELFTLTLGTRH